jgi:hypothetical protein
MVQQIALLSKLHQDTEDDLPMIVRLEEAVIELNEMWIPQLLEEECFFTHGLSLLVGHLPTHDDFF